MTRPYSELPRELWPRDIEVAGWTIRPASVDDLPSLARLRSSCAGTEAPAVSPTAQAPESLVVAERDGTGELDAAFGTRPVRMLAADGASLAFGAIDTWLNHAAAGYAGDDAPLVVRCGWRHAELFCGPDKQVVVFGAPTLTRLRHGRRYGAPGHAQGMEVIKTRTQLVLPRARYRDLFDGFPNLEVDEAASPPEGLKDLHASLASDWGVSAIRDGATYAAPSWRLAAGRVATGYAFATVGANEDVPRATAALIDLRPCSDGRTRLAVADWLCGPFDYDAGLSLLRHAISRAQAENHDEIIIELPEWTPWFSHFQWNGFRVRETGGFIVARAFHRNLGGQFLRDRWYLTAADLIGTE